jgi:muramoyltetrapeptide carboxypeptidase
MGIESRRIAVISPSGPSSEAEREQSISLLRSWGHEVVEGAHLGAKWRYLGGTHQQRCDDLRWAFETPDIDVIWIARGGFGVQHCLEAMQESRFDDRIVVGSSDATALLQWLHVRGHSRLWHGPMVDSLANGVDDATRASVCAILQGHTHGEMVVESAHAAPACEGVLVGGNLTMLASLCGSAWQLQARDAILMLEDITEHAFRLDRSLLQLGNSGALDGVRAVVLGEFTRCYLPAGADYTAGELVTDLLKPLDVPVFVAAPFGHGSANVAWPYGQLARIEGKRLSF